MIILLTKATIWSENMHGYLSTEIISSEKRTDFRERSFEKKNTSPRTNIVAHFWANLGKLYKLPFLSHKGQNY